MTSDTEARHCFYNQAFKMDQNGMGENNKNYLTLSNKTKSSSS